MCAFYMLHLLAFKQIFFGSFITLSHIKNEHLLYKSYSYLRYAMNYGQRSKVSRYKISGHYVCLEWINMKKVKIY